MTLVSTLGGLDATIKLAAALCRRFEGLSLKPYLCPAGVWTIGYGSTLHADGRKVARADAPITHAQADALLMLTLRRDYLPQTLALCPTADTPGRLAALVDFAYNCGVGNLRNSTLRRVVNARRWGDAPAQLARWDRGGGKVLRGLTLRRHAESAMIRP